MGCMVCGINVLAVLIASVVAFVFGYVWYGPLFGEQWRKMALGKKKQEVFNPGSLALSFVSMVVMVAVFAFLLGLTGKTGWLNGLGLGLLIWFGFTATESLGMVLWMKKPWKLYFLNNAFVIIQFSLIGAILGAMG
jgi:hypothetical protein